MKTSTLSRVADVAGKTAEWLVLVVLLVFSIPPVLVQHESLTPITALQLIDDSWILDTSYKAANGVWFGRDVAFTYGPLFQWLSSAPSHWIGISMGSILATSHTLPLLATDLALFAFARLLLPGASAWRRALFVFLAIVFWSPPDLRMSLSLLAFAIFVRLTHAVAGKTASVFLSAFAAALICIAACLVSIDTGIYVTAALLICSSATAVVLQRRRALAGFVLVTAALFTTGMTVINALMVSALDFKFWRSSLEIATGYRWFEPLAMSKADKRLVLEILAMGIVVFGAAWFWRNRTGPWTRRPAFLLAGFPLAFLIMQSALVRSDHGHVTVGIFAMVVLSGAIALDEFGTRPVLALIPAALAIAATLAFAHPFGAFLPGSVVARMRNFLRPVVDCPAWLEEFGRACLPRDQAELLRTISAYVDSRTTPGKSIAIFPYETAFGLISRREVAGGVMQSYLVVGDYLTQLEIAGLQRNDPSLGLYFPDGLLSFAIDSIPNFTRSPQLWLYLLEHYRGEPSPFTGAIGLTADHGRGSRLSLSQQTIADPLNPFRILKRSSTIELGPVRWPAGGADFIKLRVRADYPPWWRMRKPSKLALRMFFKDGSVKTVEFLVPPNQMSDVWIYPWEDKAMAGYFFDDPAQWRRPEPRPPVSQLTLLVNPFDWLSVTPSTVAIESIEGVRLEMK